MLWKLKKHQHDKVDMCTVRMQELKTFLEEENLEKNQL